MEMLPSASRRPSRLHAVRDVDETRQFIAGVVRAEMARQKVTDTMLAAHLGQNQQWFSRRKLGHVAFDAAELLVIADYLGLPITHFFGLAPTTPGPGNSERHPEGCRCVECARRDSNPQPSDP